MTALLLAAALTLSPYAGAVEPADHHGSGSCTSHSWANPPDELRVLRIHHKGSRVPKRIERWDTDRYVAAVMASGAWPNRVWESAKVGALAIRQYAVWMALNTCRTWKGHRYDITDGEQYLRADVRPRSRLPVRTVRVVRIMAGTFVVKAGRHFRTGWTGGRCRDGWHLCEDSIRELAQRGWGWRRIVHWALDPVTIHE